MRTTPSLATEIAKFESPAGDLQASYPAASFLCEPSGWGAKAAAVAGPQRRIQRSSDPGATPRRAEALTLGREERQWRNTGSCPQLTPAAARHSQGVPRLQPRGSRPHQHLTGRSWPCNGCSSPLPRLERITCWCPIVRWMRTILSGLTFINLDF